MSKVTIQKQDRFTELKSYRNFLKEKEKLRAKYPNEPWKPQRQGRPNKEEPYESWWDEWLEYKKEITDLMFNPNGHFQNFMWDIEGEQDEIKAMRRANGITRGIHYSG
tara:strand:+ start:3388 stop:3711 length:324 start_codon:yes stop_codon:yes gene_type:complete